LGEVIPHDEAERRGEVYDQRNQTYLFDLSTDYAVDALRKGNKTRFINHSSNPNIAPRLLTVNGDFRIGFFAKTNIPAQSEVRLKEAVAVVLTIGDVLTNALWNFTAVLRLW
jgi:histone-lysine N-methyltransferase EZH2